MHFIFLFFMEANHVLEVRAGGWGRGHSVSHTHFVKWANKWRRGFHILHGPRNFFQGGGGPGPMARNSLDQCMFFLVFFSLQLTYFTVYRSRGDPMVLLHRKLCFSRIQRGSNIFQWGPTFSRGVCVRGGGGGFKC